MISRRILILNGPNLNMLGMREPELYGSTTLFSIEEMCSKRARELDMTVDCRQSNHEGELVTWIQQARGKFGGIVINAAAYSHTSIAILDALKIASLPVVEVHITNTKEREPFRHHSYIELVAAKTIAGLGPDGYLHALDFLAAQLKDKAPPAGAA